MRELTREEVLAMEPGWDLDELVAIKVMGREHNKTVWGEKPFNPSKNISAAWEVVEELQSSHMYTDIRTCADFYEVWITIPPFLEEIHETETVASPKLPEAICKAALLAVLEATP